jgi:hypothetical protein
MNDKIEQLKVKKFLKGMTREEKLARLQLPDKLKSKTIHQLISDHVLLLLLLLLL